MTQGRQQSVARIVLGAGKWISTADVALAADIEQKLVAAMLANIRNRGLITSQPIDGRARGELRHRVLDAAGLQEYIESDAGARLGRPLGAKDAKPRKPRTTNTETREAVARDAKAASPQDGTAGVPGQAECDGEPKPAGVRAHALRYTMDNSGELVVTTESVALVLKPAQWLPLARFLHPLAGVFA